MSLQTSPSGDRDRHLFICSYCDDFFIFTLCDFPSLITRYFMITNKKITDLMTLILIRTN